MASIKLNFTLPIVGDVEMFADSADEVGDVVMGLTRLDRELEKMQAEYHGDESEQAGPPDQDTTGDPAPEQQPPEESPQSVPESGPSESEQKVTLKDLRAQLKPLIERDRDAVKALLSKFVPEGSSVAITNVEKTDYVALSRAIEEMK